MARRADERQIACRAAIIEVWIALPDLILLNEYPDEQTYSEVGDQE